MNENEIIPVPRFVLRMVDARGFVARVQHHMRSGMTIKQAYFKAEDEYEQVFGRTRYTTYNSFMNSYYYLLNRKTRIRTFKRS